MIQLSVAMPELLLWGGLGFLAVATLLFALSACPIVGYILYVILLKRNKPDKWGRECSANEPLHQTMYAEGMAWREARADRIREVHIVNDGLNLYGEYADLGYDRAVIMIPGRTESLGYGYYFAKAYAACGYNILTIDQRAHGNSDGTYNTVGFEEHKDVLAWAAYLHEELGMDSVLLHGICIGSSCALFALTSRDCPDYMSGMVAEGMYPTFYDSFKNHMIDLKKPTFPFMDLVCFWMKVFTGHNMKHGPIHVIGSLRKPILMIHSKEDRYSLPEKAQELYDLCGSERKTLVWFEKGAHSKLRITDTDRYDGAITQFLTENFAKEVEKAETEKTPS